MKNRMVITNVIIVVKIFPIEYLYEDTILIYILIEKEFLVSHVTKLFHVKNLYGPTESEFMKVKPLAVVVYVENHFVAEMDLPIICQMFMERQKKNFVNCVRKIFRVKMH